MYAAVPRAAVDRDLPEYYRRSLTSPAEGFLSVRGAFGFPIALAPFEPLRTYAFWDKYCCHASSTGRSLRPFMTHVSIIAAAEKLFHLAISKPLSYPFVTRESDETGLPPLRRVIFFMTIVVRVRSES